jgi:hypothetical protein
MMFAACSVAVENSSPVSATGLYRELPSFFSARDTSRATVTLRQSALALARGDATVLSAEVAFAVRPRYEVRLAVPFPALRRNGTTVYGFGDMTLSGSMRVIGDSLSTHGLLMRADARFPTASEDFFPFSADSVVLGAGLEVRVGIRFAALRSAVLYTLARDRRLDRVRLDGNHLTAAASVSFPLTPRTDALVSGYFIRFEGGDSRQIMLVGLRQRLSPSVELEIDGALEGGASAARVFDEVLSVALLYRFPPRPRPSTVQSGTP